MKLKPTVAAAVLALASASTFASTYSFDGNADLMFSFDVLSTSSVSAAVTSSVVDGYGFDITSVLFDSTTPFAASSTSIGSISSDFYTFSSASIAPGWHSITVYGTALGSTYHGNVVTTAAVPEPETYALMLAGLGVGGFLMMRRKAN